MLRRSVPNVGGILKFFRFYPLIFSIGLVLYVGAFFLPSVFEHGSPPLKGYDCAAITLIQIWTHDSRALIRTEPLTYVSMVVSGWINPLFIISMILVPIRSAQKSVGILRTVILLMIPFSWIAIHNLKVYPREGHFLWIFGMLLVLFSSKFRKA
jgi:hypothetical protein